MKSSKYSLGMLSAAAVAILSAAILLLPIRAAISQQPPAMEHVVHGSGQMPGTMQHDGQSVTAMYGPQSAAAVPTMPGQDAFGAIQEIVRILEADPETDWSKVDLEALRQHLIDMHEVTLRADAAVKRTEGGLEIAVTGNGHTLAAIQRMVPAHARELDAVSGWSARTEPLPTGVLLTVTSSDPKEIAHIQGLGLVGLLVSGSHDQPHHLAMAKGEFDHAHARPRDPK
jgi:hypothetical protein